MRRGAPNLRTVTGAVAVALAAALVAAVAAAVASLAMTRARKTTRTLEAEVERGKAAFDAVVADEVERRASDLARTLALARAESLAALAEEERRITEERRIDVAERERDASARLGGALTAAQRRVEERLAEWSRDLNQLQESLGEEVAKLSERQAALTTEIERRIEADSARVEAALEEHRVLITTLREGLAQGVQTAITAAAAELEQHGIERRKALQELTDRLRLRERELKEQIDLEQADAVQRVATQLGDVEHRQLEQVRRAVSREATRYAEAAVQQFDTAIRTAREETARRLGRELDLSVERFSREADGVLAERVDRVADAAIERVKVRLVNLGGGLGQEREAALRALEQSAHEVEAGLRRRLDGIAAEAESERAAIAVRLHDLQRRLDDLAARS